MKNNLVKIIFLLLTLPLSSLAQTSWKGTVSTDWNNTSNWTAGVPTSSVDAFIGNASFTGAFQPTLTGTTSLCKSLTIGGTVASTLNVAKNIIISGDVTLAANGTILHSGSSTTITVAGNWNNGGTYNATAAIATVIFSGTAGTLTGVTSFKRMTINTGSTITLASNISVSSILTVSGILDPALLVVSGAGTFTVNSGGTIRVQAATYAANYTISGLLTLNGKSTVDYASSTINQTVSNTLTYGYLRISGGLTKTLAGNLPALNSSSSTSGRITIAAGTLDLLGFTANRGTTTIGGTFTMSIGATMKIGGTNTFPANFNTVTIASNSTVEYNGTTQVVAVKAYGNLTLSSGSGAVVKTMPATAMTVAGNFTMNAGAGTGVTFTASAILTINQNISLDATSTLNGGAFSHKFKANWTNNGIFNGNTSTVTFSGVNAVLSGTGTNNFGTLSFSSAGITADGTTAITVSGSLSTSGSGTFLHNTGGTLTMNGAAKTISGNGFKLYNYTASGTITASADITVSGDFTVPLAGSFASSSLTVTLNGVSKSINASGTLTFYSLSVAGSITTASNFSILANFSVSIAGSFTASSGTVTFNGTSVLSGTAGCNTVIINSGKTLRLGSNSIIGISGTFTKTGTLDVTTNVPNTVNFNGAGAQLITSATYYNLILSTGGTKTLSAATIVNNDFTINASVTFNASTFTMSIYRHWTNNGTFNAGSSTVQLLGVNAATMTGASTFSTLIVNKNSALIWVTLNNSITAATLTMTLGNITTGINSVTVTTTRTGNGIILGTIIHNHSFLTGTSYYFEGPQNSIVFTTPVSINSVTVNVTLGEIIDFDPTRQSILRQYTVTIPSGTYTSAALRLHYEDNELNAFDEPNLSEFKFNSGVTWDSIGFTSKDGTANYVEKTGITTVTGRWTLSGKRNVVRWNGSVSSAWENASNWTTISGSSMSNRVPVLTDEVEIGQATFSNQPAVNSVRQVSALRFGSTQNVVLTISSGSLEAIGTVKGTWSANASHVLDVASAALIVGTNMYLSDGTIGHTITLKIGTGTVTINKDLTQNASGAVNFTGNGSLILSGNYFYTAGTFTAGTGTVVYTGANSQLAAPITYNNLTLTKTTEQATLASNTQVNGNLTTSGGGELLVNDTLLVAGNVTIGAGTILEEGGTLISIGGNWVNNGIFTVHNGTLNFNGTGAQTINLNTLNNLAVNKTSGTLTLVDNLTINSDLTLTTGIVDMSAFAADRSNPGGTLTMGPSTILKLSGANNFPGNYITDLLDVMSTVLYYGTGTQNIADVLYGNLTLTGGGATPKALVENTVVYGDVLINAGATIDPGTFSFKLNGNITNNGTFLPSASTLELDGISKNINGSLTIFNLDVNGSYTVAGGNVAIAGDALVDATGSFNAGAGTITMDGDFVNKGSIFSSGTVTFTGTQVQTIQLLNAITSTSSGILNFNGTVSPIINSTSSPSFATVNINNTGGVAPSVPWTVYFALNVAVGATFDVGSMTHTIYGNFTNNGTVLSSGNLFFKPGAPFSSSVTIKLDGTSFISTNRVTFGGTVPITLVGTNPVFNTVYVTNTDMSGITPFASWTIGQDLLIGAGATFFGGSAFDHNIMGDLVNNGTLSGQTSNIHFNSPAGAIAGSGTTNFNTITFETGSFITFQKSVQVAGNFTVNGGFDATGRTVNFNGTTNSIINGTSTPVVFDYMEQSKTSGTTMLSLPVTVQSGLTLTNGIIMTNTSNILTLLDDAVASTGTVNSYVDGPMRKIGNDAFVFPVGNTTIWARLAISAPASTTAAFDAQYFNAAYSNTSSVTAPLNTVSTVEYWNLNRTAGSDNVAVTLYWENGARSGINYPSQTVVAHFPVSSWISETQAGGFTGTVAAGSMTSQVVSSFGPFTFGFPIGLPVEYLSFTATAHPSSVVLQWQTATEINNDYFTVERSKNGIYFEQVANVKSSGTTAEQKSYSQADNHPYKGISYYRIKQTDMDGKYSYSSVVSINVDSKGTVKVYPNVIGNSDDITISLTETTDTEIIFQLMNQEGRCVFQKSVSGNSSVALSGIGNEYPNGIYSLVVNSGNESFTEKIVIAK